MTDAVTNTLGNLIQSDQLLRAQVDTGMGFYIGKYEMIKFYFVT